MADYTFANLTSAVTGVVTTTQFKVQSTAAYTQTATNGTVRLGNISNVGLGTAYSASSGKRPVLGMLFPRGVYNK